MGIMRLVVTICLAAMWALIVASSVDADKARHKQPARCDIIHKHVMIADSQAMVYRSIEAFEPPIVFGCAFKPGRVFELGESATEGSCSPSGCIHIKQEVLTGTLVAYERFSTDGEGESSFFIVVRNLQSGRTVHRVPTGTPIPANPQVSGNGFASDIAVKNDGAVAWINENEVGETTEYQVHVLDKIGNRLLASGTDIDPHSLALSGSTLYWMQGGKPFSTRLD